MQILHSLILGIVEGLTEFLPISSTFHLIVTSRILRLPSTDYLKLFEVVIQSGAIISLLFVYLNTLLRDRVLLSRVMYSFFPTALIGLLLHKVIKSIFFETTWLMLLAFVVVGIIFLLLERSIRENKRTLTLTCESLTIKQALLIGLAQAISVVPGVSRAGSVIVAMILLGYKRDEAAKYTFLLSMPTILAASVLDIFQGRELLYSVGSGWLLLGIGFVTSMFTAYFVMKWLIRYLSTHTLEIFGWYRLVLALVLVLTKVLP